VAACSPWIGRQRYLDDRVAVGEPKSSRSIAETPSSEEVDLERAEWKVPELLADPEAGNCTPRKRWVESLEVQVMSSL
jgi:hypothetical protein